MKSFVLATSSELVCLVPYLQNWISMCIEEQSKGSPNIVVYSK